MYDYDFDTEEPIKTFTFAPILNSSEGVKGKNWPQVHSEGIYDGGAL